VDADIHLDLLFDRKFAFLAILAKSFVDTAVGSAANETHNMISVSHPDFAGVPRSSRWAGVISV
jgi:hypothetical protein